MQQRRVNSDNSIRAEQKTITTYTCMYLNKNFSSGWQINELPKGKFMRQTYITLLLLISLKFSCTLAVVVLSSPVT